MTMAAMTARQIEDFARRVWPDLRAAAADRANGGKGTIQGVNSGYRLDGSDDYVFPAFWPDITAAQWTQAWVNRRVQQGRSVYCYADGNFCDVTTLEDRPSDGLYLSPGLLPGGGCYTLWLVIQYQGRAYTPHTETLAHLCYWRADQ
jgi:hypothetical protein